MLPAIFLDRDGVIIKNRSSYVRNWSHVVFYQSALTALARLSELPYKIIIVTNQSAVGQGLISIATANELNHLIVAKIVKAGGRIDSLFMCPHLPLDHCSCRKPKPGLLVQAAEALSIDLKRSVMIGDAVSDIQAGQNAGVAKTILVLTGRGRSQLMHEAIIHQKSFLIYQSLSHAVNHLDQWISSTSRE